MSAPRLPGANLIPAGNEWAAAGCSTGPLGKLRSCTPNVAEGSEKRQGADLPKGHKRRPFLSDRIRVIKSGKSPFGQKR